MIKRVVLCALALIGSLCCLMAVGYADTLRSTHYQVEESSLGDGGLIQSSSANYQAGGAGGGGGGTVGDTAVGDSSSANYQTRAGANTSVDPYLSCAITSPTASFGAFSATSTSTATASFEVADYTSFGYVVQIDGSPPSYQNHTISAMATAGSPTTGTDQFGINLVANTSPASFGANPVQLPDNTFSFGQVNPNYSTANQFRYVDGDVIASSSKSSGITDFTISYIINVNNLDPGGAYTAHQSLVCMATY